MKTAILTIGPQHVGKSTFCKKIIREHQHIQVVSRDQIFLDLFSTSEKDRGLSDFDQRHPAIFAAMWNLVECHVNDDSSKDLTLILDCWNRDATDRLMITHTLKKLGFDVVGGWYFITPFTVCKSWQVAEKPKPQKRPFLAFPWEQNLAVTIQMARQSEQFRQYRLYHSHKVELSQGFDFLVQLDPLDPPSSETLFNTKCAARPT